MSPLFTGDTINVFLVPYGSASSHFIFELAKLYESFGSASAMECIALKAAVVLPALLLQKPHIQSKSSRNIKCLECCLHLWYGDNDALLIEGHTIQQHLQHSHCTPWLIALTYLLAWFSRERLKLPCGSSQNSLGAHSWLSPLQLESLLSSLNLLRNILMLSQLLQ